MSAPLRDWLVREGVLPEAVLQKAVARQTVYGGTLDTALLETGAMSEAAIWVRLAAASALPMPPPWLCDGSRLGDAEPQLSADRAAALRVVPVAADERSRTMTFLCAEPIAVDEIRAAAAEQGLEARLCIVPEVRLLAARQYVYGESVPGRYARLLGRVAGDARALGHRRATTAGSKPVAGAAIAAPPPSPSPGTESVAQGEAAFAVSAADGGAAPMFESFDLGELSDAPEPPGSAVAAVRPPGEFDRRSGDGTAAPSAPAPTPLEFVLESSGTLAFDHGAAEVEVEVEPGTQPPAPPVRLEVVSEIAVDAAAVIVAPSMDPGSGEGATEALCRRARDLDDKGRLLALRALRRRLTHPAVGNLIDELRATVGSSDAAARIAAAAALAELRDGQSVPILVAQLTENGDQLPLDVAQAIRDALVVLCAQDFGRSVKRWRAWAARNAESPRPEWLLEGLDHKSGDIRRAAAEDLRQLSGDTFAYAADLPKRERDEARRRWVAWWRATQSRAEQRPDGGPISPAGSDPLETLNSSLDSASPPAPLGASTAAPPHGPRDHSPASPPFPLPPAPKAR